MSLETDKVFRRRRFILAVATLVAGTAGLFYDRDLASYTLLAGTVLGLYSFVPLNKGN